MINILYDLQLSMVKGERFLTHRDSNVNVAESILKQLTKRNTDMKFYVLVPPVQMCSSDQLSTTKQVKLIDYPYNLNSFVDRMSIDTKSLQLINVSIDLVYTNDPCKVLSYKNFFYYKQNKMVPVISRNHWVTGKIDRKVPTDIDFMIRQVEGAIYGDWMTFNSHYAVQVFLDGAKEFYNDATISNIQHKLSVIEMVNVSKIDKYKTSERFSIFTILWAHRLSYYTGWKETFKQLLKLWDRRKDFQVIVPDPGDKFSQQYLKDLYPFVGIIDKSTWDYESYIKTCWKSDICLGNHSYPATWGGLAITEPMAAYTVPIMPYRHGYMEMFYPLFPPFFKTNDEMIQCIEMYMDDASLLDQHKKLARDFCEKDLSMDNFIGTVEDKVRLLCM